ncbi:MAG: DNA topoisomerase I [Sorangiineae bacterium NIC37A_2]|nr:MAG: DNA topoisomerase I [Sorangiineae bacterium NIC37A_2]
MIGVDTRPGQHNLASRVSKSLVIVESPAKARTISGFLGKKYVVESSIGHIRDLPRSAADIPAKYKKEPWARLGVDVDHDFRPLYIVDSDKKEHIKKLQALADQADEILLATDEDREGESIAWHLLEVLKPRVPVKRMVFHEITEKAIQAAIDSPRELDRRLVDAQEARRILDRLYGYEVSPVLWKKVMPRLSAGRVQSVATRIVVERERERIAFSSATYWDIEAEFEAPKGTPPRFPATLTSVDGQRLATGKDFDDSGKLKKDIRLLTEKEANELARALEGRDARVTSVERKPNRRSPAAPFMTSTLQQEAGRKLRYSSSRTMRAAQRLYENGFITYMRTDSTTLSDTALAAARSLIGKLYGPEYLPKSPRLYKNKVKNAQEAHEAIRPAGDEFQHPDDVARQVGPDEAKLYELIWKRTVASQMEDARGESVSVLLEMDASGTKAEFSVRGNTITFPGFLRAYVEGSDDPSAELENRENPLPPLSEGMIVKPQKLAPTGHETQPPARYTEASLVRRLEELGVGRPSTYASIIATILDRGYVWKRGTALVPTFRAFAVVTLLEKHFGELVDFAFTARMEDELDAIAGGNAEAVPWLRNFYFGLNGKANPERPLDVGLKALVANNLGEIDARAINSLPIGEDDSGVPIVARVGRYGAYLSRGEDTANIPDDLAPDELTREKALELLSAPSGERLIGTHPESGLPIFAKAGRFGAYLQVGVLEKDSKEKPQTASLLKSQSPQTITLEEALALLSLPRTVGVDPADGVEITAQIGRYGPYVAKGKDSRSLEREEQVFTVTLEEALALFAAPRRRGARKVVEPLRELGLDPVSGGLITMREGRFGIYVTDGETNASLRREDDPKTMTPERAHELLQLRREAGPSAKKAKKKASKKAAGEAAPKATAKKAAKKTVAKKAAAKKTVKKAAKTTAKKTTTRSKSKSEEASPSAE